MFYSWIFFSSKYIFCNTKSIVLLQVTKVAMQNFLRLHYKQEGNHREQQIKTMINWLMVHGKPTIEDRGQVRLFFFLVSATLKKNQKPRKSAVIFFVFFLISVTFFCLPKTKKKCSYIVIFLVSAISFYLPKTKKKCSYIFRFFFSFRYIFLPRTKKKCSYITFSFRNFLLFIKNQEKV